MVDVVGGDAATRGAFRRRRESGNPPAVPAEEALEAVTEFLEAMDAAFDHMTSVVRGMDREARMQDVTYFGTDTTVGVAITMAASAMHEHLGQLIAYARTNHIVPPWSG